MFYLEQYLHQLDGIFDILKHKNTASEGRYSVLTTSKTFSSNASAIKEHLETWVTDITNKQGHNINQSLIPKVWFKGKLAEDELNGNQSYLSACSTIYLYTEFSINEAPSTQGPVTQAWGALLSIPGTIEATTSTGVSILSHDEFNCVINENAWLSNEITVPKQQMAALLKHKTTKSIIQQLTSRTHPKYSTIRNATSKYNHNARIYHSCCPTHATNATNESI